MPNYVLGAYQGHDGSIAIVGEGKIVHFETERFTRKRHDTLALMDRVDDACKLIGIEREQITATAGVSGMFAATRDVWTDLNQHDKNKSVDACSTLGVDCYGIPHHTAHAAYAFYTSPFDAANVLAMDGGGDAYEDPFLGKRVITTAIGTGFHGKLSVNYEPCNGIGGAWNEASHQIFGEQFQEGKVMALVGVPEDSLTNGLRPTHARVLKLQQLTNEAFFQCVPRGVPVCIAGGCALNGIAVYALLRAKWVPEVWVPPACDDGGLSVGAAMYVLHNILGEPRRRYRVMDVAFAGYSEPDLEGFVPINRIARALADGKVVALAHGRAESGPRALGHRSLLADPRTMESKDRLNVMKGRELWRPIAPVVQERWAARYFNLIDQDAYNFMTTIAQATELAMEKAPAIVHLDGSARVQVVRRDCVLGHILESFRQLTGVPVLCNTSLNCKGQPMVNTAEEAVRSARAMGADMIAVGSEVMQ